MPGVTWGTMCSCARCSSSIWGSSWTSAEATALRRNDSPSVVVACGFTALFARCWAVERVSKSERTYSTFVLWENEAWATPKSGLRERVANADMSVSFSHLTISCLSELKTLLATQITGLFKLPVDKVVLESSNWSEKVYLEAVIGEVLEVVLALPEIKPASASIIAKSTIPALINGCNDS